MQTQHNSLYRTALDRMLRGKLIAVIRMDDPGQAREAIEAIVAGGITIIEITLTTPEAPRLIESFAQRPELLIGAGTVLDADAAREVAAAGARFLASPIFDPGVVELARESGLVSMPGAYTPTEILTASRAGADIIKIFPMPADGAAYISSLMGPLPLLRLAPSGGVNAVTAPMLLAAGAAALNVGSWLTHERGGAPGIPEHISARAAGLVAAAYN